MTSNKERVMNDMPEPHDAADFLTVIKTFWPLAVVGGVAGFARGFKNICRGGHVSSRCSLLWYRAPWCLSSVCSACLSCMMERSA